MIAKLNQELSAALHAAGDRELAVIDPDTQRTYFLVDEETHLRAMQALRQQQDRDAIAAGLIQMQAGEGQPLDRAFSDMRTRMGFSQPQ